MQIQEVQTAKQKKAFLELPLVIYKNDPHWIQPLNQDIESVFDQQKNQLFQEGGKLIRWILIKDHQVIGRLAAFVNPHYKEKQPTGGIGFFECVNHQEAAHLLFDTAKQWLISQGMQAMDGPINFGERDQWWGLLVEGFHPPLYNMNYHLPYYKTLFESYGFQNYFNQECFSLPINAELSERMNYFHQRIKRSNLYKAEHLQKKNLQKYIQDFLIIYNDAWSTHGGGKQLTLHQAETIFKQMKPVIEEKLVWFVYHEDRPIAFWINLPDLNHYFKKMNGKFGLWQKIYFLLLQKFSPNPKAVGLVFGVVKDFQGRGVDAYMIIEGRKVMARDLSYSDYEMQWIGDFNPKMIKIAYELGAQLSRRLTTYRYLFDADIPFERHRIL